MECILCWPTTPKHGACLSVVNRPSDTPPEKTCFPFPSRYQLHIASWLGVGLCPLPLLHGGILSGLDLCRQVLFVLSQSLCVHMYISPVVSG